MKIEAEIKKWGNSLALRVSGAMAELPQFKAGTPVIIEITEQGFNVTHKRAPHKQLLSEKELLKHLTPELAHADALTTPDDSEWSQ